MDCSTAAFILSAFLFAAFLKGITGLGFSTICLPILTLVLEPKVSIPLVIFPSLLSNVLVMVQAGNFKKALARFWPVYISAGPGLLLGFTVLLAVHSSVSRTILGIILIIYAAWAFYTPGFTLSGRAETLMAVPVGLCTGIVNGITGSQVMPVLPYMLSLRLDKNTFVQAINLSFTFSSLIMLVLLRRADLLGMNVLATSLMGVVPVFAGTFSGGRIRAALGEDRFRQAVLAFLLVIGLSLIVRA